MLMCMHVCMCVHACVCMCAHVYMHVNVNAHGCMCVHVDIVLVCSFMSLTSYTHIGLSSLVFGQAGLTIDWNWTSQARGVSSYTCTLFCECVCVCVCSICLEYVFLCFNNISACYQVGLNSPSIVKLDLSSKGS